MKNNVGKLRMKKYVPMLIFILIAALCINISDAVPDENAVRVISENQLTTDKADDAYPAWSPDGSKIAFTSIRNGNSDIFVMDSDGSNQKPLTTDPSMDFYPSWSPDGKHIVFTSDRIGYPEIWIMDSDGSNQKQLTMNTGKFNLFSRWIRYGSETKIVYLSIDPKYTAATPATIMLMDSDGKNQETFAVLTPGMDKNYPFTTFVYNLFIFSPDGNKILFFEKPKETTYRDLKIMNADGSNQKQLTINEPVSTPEWSPDGTMIAFSKGSPYSDIWIMNGDGGNKSQLTKNESHNSYPSWSPDGTKIAFASDRSGNYDIWVVKFNESELLGTVGDSKIWYVFKQYLPYLSVMILVGFFFVFKERIVIGFYMLRMKKWKKEGYDTSKLEEVLKR